MSRRTLLVVGSLLLLSGCQGEGSGGGSATTTTNTAATIAPKASAPTTTVTATAATAAPTAPTAVGVGDEPPPAPAPTAVVAPLPIATPGQPGAVAPTASFTFSVVPAPGVAKAEDGSGAMIAANDPVFLDVRGGVGGQALGPELSIGQLRFRDHRYPSPGVVRFTCADKSLLTRGAEVALVYGSKRIVVSSSLVVP